MAMDLRQISYGKEQSHLSLFDLIFYERQLV